MGDPYIFGFVGMKIMTIDEMSNIYGVSEKTIKKNLSNIPGAIVEEETITFTDGTRYPFNIGHSKLDDSGKRRYVLLKAISQSRYIDRKMLRVTQNDFLLFLKQLLNEGWIEENNSCNNYGANKYSITLSGEQILEQRKKDRILTTAESTGTFVGAFMSQMIEK